MLVGAVVNMRPELFAAAVAEVPFVDCVNTILDASLPLTPPEWPEWGNPIKDEAAYRTMLSYSPYDNVRAQAYPHMLVTAGLTDPRVTYWEPAKWVARLRVVGTGDRMLLLRTEMSAGHGGAAGRYDKLKEVAIAYAFALLATGKV
jgi:oligopeptidase B